MIIITSPEDGSAFLTALYAVIPAHAIGAVLTRSAFVLARYLGLGTKTYSA
jgi:hypothetical protein